MQKVESRQTDTGIEIKEFYSGAATTVFKAYLNGQCIAIAKDKISLIRALNKRG